MRRLTPGARRRVLVAGLAATVALVGAAAASPASPFPIVCRLAPGKVTLPPGARHGLAAHLVQYPDLSLASMQERRTARRLAARIQAAVSRFRDPAAARRAGFATHLARRRASDRSIGWLHAESRRFSADRHSLDPRRPEALIYARQPGHGLTLVGVMFSLPRGVRGRVLAGSIARWHSHIVCVADGDRGLAPRSDGSCPRGARRGQGSEMLHVWFTRDLRSAFAVHAPVPELCRDGLLLPASCRGGATRGM